jgi:hypothetical protein
MYEATQNLLSAPVERVLAQVGEGRDRQTILWARPDGIVPWEAHVGGGRTNGPSGD